VEIERLQDETTAAAVRALTEWMAQHAARLRG
jgi:hypothetical protein